MNEGLLERMNEPRSMKKNHADSVVRSAKCMVEVYTETWGLMCMRPDWVEKRKRGRRGRWSRGKAVRFGVGADRTLDRVPPASEPRAGLSGPLQRCSGSGVRWEACGNSEFGALPTASGSVGLGGARGLGISHPLPGDGDDAGPGTSLRGLGTERLRVRALDSHRSRWGLPDKKQGI